MKKVIVTGASGFIGRQALPLLAEKGYQVNALAWPDLPEHLPEARGLVWHKLDLFDRAAVTREKRGQDPQG